MGDKSNIEKEVLRIDGNLFESIKIKDDNGNIVQTFQLPLRVELKIQDVLEIMVGASILAVPVAFTEEVWNLGNDLHWYNVLALNTVCILFMGSFIYFKSYRKIPLNPFYVLWSKIRDVNVFRQILIYTIFKVIYKNSTLHSKFFRLWIVFY